MLDANRAEQPIAVRDTAPIAQLAHRTAERWRLKVPTRRHDLGYFISLYEALRVQPEIQEVTVNPLTASVLVWFAPTDEKTLPDALTRNGLLRLAEDPRSAAATASANNELHPSEHHAFHMSVNDTRILVFLIVVALSVYQLTKKQFLAPALTLSLYLIDLFAGLKLEQDAAARAEQSADRSALQAPQQSTEQAAQEAAERAAH